MRNNDTIVVLAVDAALRAAIAVPGGLAIEFDDLIVAMVGYFVGMQPDASKREAIQDRIAKALVVQSVAMVGARRAQELYDKAVAGGARKIEF